MVLTKSILEKEYAINGLTDLQISEKYSLDRTTISKMRKENEIKTRFNIGLYGESIVVNNLKKRMYNVKNMNEISMTYPYDLLINGKTRVDVKAAGVSSDNSFKFSLTDKVESGKIESENRIRLPNGRTKKIYQNTCDLLFFIGLNDKDDYHLFIIPPKYLPLNIQTVSIPTSLNSKYVVFKDRWDLLEEVSNEVLEL